MFRSFYLLITVASLAGAMFFSSEGARPRQIYAETWQAQAIPNAASPR
jgi:hypothetical protein